MKNSPNSFLSNDRSISSSIESFRESVICSHLDRLSSFPVLLYTVADPFSRYTVACTSFCEIETVELVPTATLFQNCRFIVFALSELNQRLELKSVKSSQILYFSSPSLSSLKSPIPSNEIFTAPTFTNTFSHLNSFADPEIAVL